MKTDFETDILISGLGPAGASAARAAAESGLRVIAVERNAKPGLPVQCAEFVPMMIGSEIPGIGAVSIQNIDRMLTYVSDEDADQTSDFRGYMIDRAQFDAELVRQAIEAGAECRFSTPLRTILPGGTAELADGTTIGAKIVVAADGPRSPIGKVVDNTNTELVETRQITVDLLAPHSGTDIFLHPDIVGGYAWMFPKGNVCNIGIGVSVEYKHRLKPLLSALHKNLATQGRVGRNIHSHTGGPIPVGGMLPLHKHHGDIDILFCGDAAGLTNPVTGAGINSAVISGSLAGEAAVNLVRGDADAAEDYGDEIHALFGHSIGLAFGRRQALLKAYLDGASPGAAQLRDGWIAYPQYWQDDTMVTKTEIDNNPEQARSFA
jgi:digeranylgeranylglycerophospholipid reductase